MLEILTNSFHFAELPPCPSGVVELDMGCGKGKFTLELGRRYPERLILGSDVMMGRLRRLDRKVEKGGLENVRLLRAESLQLVAFQLPPQCLDRIHLLCPDPWPKERHEVKRLVCSDFLCRLRRVLKPGGILHMSTDHAPYFDAWMKVIGQLSWFERADGASDDVADIKTDFEKQWLEQGKVVQHVNWRLVAE